uniref:Phosphodiesterase n=1 Tax=Branchiostoma floridae TaxID=7739 RepID=C3YL20_BRAFL|eukprot:XP_002602999.1 hypothetical protein BRAFLDRAFT_84734 [Branchiostoma floridae]
MGIIGYVAEHGVQLNVPDAYQDSRFCDEVDKSTGYRTRSILCMPIKDSEGEVIGVAQAINKNPDGMPFDEEDVKVFATYLPFCGIGITNAKLFDISMREQERNRVWFLFYHRTKCGIYQWPVNAMYVCRFSGKMRRVFEPILEDYTLYTVQSSESGSAPLVSNGIMDYVASRGEAVNIPDAYQDPRFDSEAFAIFCGLGINNTLMYSEITKAMAKQSVALEVVSYHAVVSEEDVESLKTLCRLMLTVRKNYRNVAYHNWRHAFNVCQVMHALLTNGGMGEDLFSDDPGDQLRQQAGGLAEKMSSMEMLVLLVACLCHDLDHRGTNNAFQQKSQSPLAKLYGTFATMEHHHFNHAVMILNNQSHNIFSNLTNEEYSKVMKMLKHAILSTDLTLHFHGMLMTACDLAAVTKPWEIQKKALVKVEPRLAPLRDGVMSNRDKWLKLNEERKSSMSVQSDEDRAIAGSTDSGGEDPSSVTAEYREEEALRRSFDSIEEGPSSPKAPPPTPREVKAVHFQEPLFERRGLTSKRHSITGRPFDRRLKVQTSISDRQIIVSRKWRSYEEKGGNGAQS